MEICLGKTVDDNLLQVMRKEVQQLSDSLDDFKDKDDKDIKSICSTLALLKSELNRAIQVLKNQHQRLQSTCMELRKNQDMIKEEISSKDRDQKEMLRISELHWETRQQQVDDICKTLEVRSQVMKKDLEMLKVKMDNLSFSDSPIDMSSLRPQIKTNGYSKRKRRMQYKRLCNYKLCYTSLFSVQLCRLSSRSFERIQMTVTTIRKLSVKRQCFV